MTTSGELRSGKGHRDENFPVASALIARRHRPAILAFYEFVRVADDIADHPQLSASEKIDRLNNLEASLLGVNDQELEGVRLRQILWARGLSPQHAQDLLRAFRQDATKLRYENWDELIDYCRYSAMPVGRFVLDVHGEATATWPANDALCAALQIINHIQDCQKDYRALDRVYLPRDALAAHGLTVEALDRPCADNALKACLADLTRRTAQLLERSRPFARIIEDTRLAAEVAAIQALAERLIAVLLKHDPLSERVHLGKLSMLVTGAKGVGRLLLRRWFMRRAMPAAGTGIAE